jgi:hypothetical protein
MSSNPKGNIAEAGQVFRTYGGACEARLWVFVDGIEMVLRRMFQIGHRYAAFLRYNGRFDGFEQDLTDWTIGCKL